MNRMSSSKTCLGGWLLALGLLVTAMLSACATRPEEGTASVQEGSPSMDSELVADFGIEVYQGEDVLGGQSVKFSELLARERPVVLSFWAGLCPVCRFEMPGLEEAHIKYGDRVLILGVDIGPFVNLGTRQDALALLSELGVTYPAGATPDSSVIEDYGVLGTPTTVFVTPSGDVVDRRHGIFAPGQLDGIIEALLEASSGS